MNFYNTKNWPLFNSPINLHKFDIKLWNKILKNLAEVTYKSDQNNKNNFSDSLYNSNKLKYFFKSWRLILYWTKLFKQEFVWFF